MTNVDPGYLEAVEQVIDLAHTLGTSLADVPSDRFDALIERPLGQLIRATNNVAAVAYKAVTEYTAVDYDDIDALRAVLEPWEHGEYFTLFPQSGDAFIEDAIMGAWWGLRDMTTGEGKLSTDDAVVPGHVGNTYLPEAFVVNGAMPVIVKLMKKVNAFNNNEPVAAGTDRIRRGHQKAIGLPH